MSDKVPLYDAFGDEYDVMVNWAERLRREAPFLDGLLRRAGGRRVLDLGSATGHHAAHFATLGYRVVGVDPSVEMVERARRNVGEGANPEFLQGGFGELQEKAGGGFDAVFCLGNTLPHVRSQQELETALRDAASVLRRGGFLVIQQLNYDRILALRQRFLGVTGGQRGDREYVFFRFYDYEADSLVFNVLIQQRPCGGNWEWRVESTRLLPILSTQLRETLMHAGFTRVTTQGSYAGELFNPLESNDLVVVAYHGSAE
ncbi:MAG: class I SAM-dependent methyltransferase [Chloroflexota bacterium]